MQFELGQVFLDSYPPEAADFCNAHGLRIAEIAPENGHRRFQIVEVFASDEV